MWSCHCCLTSGRSSGGLTDRLLNNIERLEAALLRERVGSARGEDVVDDDPSSAASSLTQLLLDSESSDRSTGNSNNNLHLSVPPERVEQLRNLRRNLRKKNYNLDHLARMNFRRSFRASSALNNKHILGGLKK